MKKSAEHSKLTITCDFCGAEFQRYCSKIKKHNFCCKSCLAAFSSKSKNPTGYNALKDYMGMSNNMRRLNATMNPTRMTEEVRLKLRKSKLSKSTCGTNTYPKYLGRHLHRIVAESTLGRALKPGEVVHHIDGNKHNNDSENLMVFASQAEHAAWHAEHDKQKEGDAK